MDPWSDLGETLERYGRKREWSLVLQRPWFGGGHALAEVACAAAPPTFRFARYGAAASARASRLGKPVVSTRALPKDLAAAWGPHRVPGLARPPIFADVARGARRLRETRRLRGEGEAFLERSRLGAPGPDGRRPGAQVAGDRGLVLPHLKPQSFAEFSAKFEWNGFARNKSPRPGVREPGRVPARRGGELVRVRAQVRRVAGDVRRARRGDDRRDGRAAAAPRAARPRGRVRVGRMPRA